MLSNAGDVSYIVCGMAQGQVSSGTRSTTRHLRVRVYAGVNLARKDIFGARYIRFWSTQYFHVHRESKKRVPP